MATKQNKKPKPVRKGVKQLLTSIAAKRGTDQAHDDMKIGRFKSNKSGKLSSRNPTRPDNFGRFSKMSASEMLDVDRKLNARKKLPHSKRGKKG